MPAARPCSFGVLAAWAARALLLGCLACGLLLGPEIAHQAWSHGAHVTPGQAALHFQLSVEQITRHHGRSAAQGGVPSAAAQPLLRDAGGLLALAGVFGQAILPPTLPWLLPVRQARLRLSRHPTHAALLRAPSPPPKPA